MGIDGYLGWPLAMHLSAKGHDVSGVDNFSRRINVEEIGGQSATPIKSMKMRLKEIIASTKWREKLVQLATSEKVPESNVNATNAYRAMGYTIVETLSSAAPWFGKGDLPEEQWGFHTIEWQAPKITGLAKDPNVPLVTKRYHGYCRVVFGISIPYNFHRNAGT